MTLNNDKMHLGHNAQQMFYHIKHFPEIILLLKTLKYYLTGTRRENDGHYMKLQILHCPWLHS